MLLASVVSARQESRLNNYKMVSCARMSFMVPVTHSYLGAYYRFLCFWSGAL